MNGPIVHNVWEERGNMIREGEISSSCFPTLQIVTPLINQEHTASWEPFEIKSAKKLPM